MRTECASPAPKARRFSRPEDAGCLRRHHLFSRKRKDGGEKSAWGREIALTREKACRDILRAIVTSAVKERPSGGAPNFVYGNIAPR